ncbi:MAG TPA: SUMF1/EgtB/PvdO family nonheme iron enzyme, partial [Gemmataceae bacterium]|nr:SUMF1/EgtB/PvdO family nonheme iron enzyme [Gemmataceae bacterium]
MIKELAPSSPVAIPPGPPKESSRETDRQPASSESKTPPIPDSGTSDSSQGASRVVPKGLRSFDAEDADFFLELLPGPRDRHDLPESLRFWKNRIEAADPERSFSVGIVYGPSGCGKSSLVKAGLLPRLTEDILVVYVEATPGHTESGLAKGLRKRFPRLNEHQDLGEIIAGLRRGHGLPPPKKVLLVLDQFEQWLHANRAEENPELVQALRQCDGQHVQCLILVRDDFGMAITRLMRDLEIPIVEGQNFATVDLFDLRHAQRILTKFGRSFGALPDNRDELTPDQERFLDEAVNGLAQDGKVICVRLALFAEMVKTRPWTSATLKEVGGTQGLGVSFLEETLGERSTNPEHKVHQRAVRGVLKALLPEQGTDIKGHVQPHQELLQASGYGRRPKEFDQLLHILDAELRLVTPTDPEGQGEEKSETPGSPGKKYYQLTHDYLVPALRQWLTRKQRETRRGRAELRLEERATLWTAKPENRHLPATWEWANILLFTRKKDWNAGQRRMMRKAGWYHGLVLGTLVVILALAGYGAWWEIQSLKGAGLVRGLASAEITDVPRIIQELGPYRRWAVADLKLMAGEGEKGSKQRLYASLALVPWGEDPESFLFQRTLSARLEEVPIIVGILQAHRPELEKEFWNEVEEPQGEPSRRFRAAMALATLAPPDSTEARARWQAQADFVANQLISSVNANFSLFTLLLEAFRPARAELLGPLQTISRDPKRSDATPRLASRLWAEYVSSDLLVNEFLTSDGRTGGMFLATLLQRGALPPALLEGELEKTPPAAESSETDKDIFARRQANAAVALFTLGKVEHLWPLLQQTGKNLRVRPYIIHHLGPLGADPRPLIRRLESDEEELSARRGLLLCLGEFSADQISKPERQRLMDESLIKIYRDHPDPGLHSAVEWLLRRWEFANQIRQIDQQLASRQSAADRQWFVNPHGHTMAVIPGPVVFWDQSRQENGFAIATKEVAVRQYREFLEAHPRVPKYALHISEQYSPDPDGPVLGVTWFEAIQYCRWLSEQEGAAENQQCYPSVDVIENARIKKTPVNLPVDFQNKTGYRLPMDNEWVYACRAGAKGNPTHGASDHLLEKYAWYIGNGRNRAWPVGLLKPNDLGLFDMYGNAYEWTNEMENPPGAKNSTGTEENGITVLGTNEFVIRGGSFNTPSDSFKSIRFSKHQALAPHSTIGFRIARTVPAKRQP